MPISTYASGYHFGTTEFIVLYAILNRRSRQSCVASRCGRLRFGSRIRLWEAADNVRISRKRINPAALLFAQEGAGNQNKRPSRGLSTPAADERV
jgi:hypothetical protein